jgi:hypothetical protein
MARALVADLGRIDRALLENRSRCAAAVMASGTSLTSVFGISDVLAAKTDATRQGLDLPLETREAQEESAGELGLAPPTPRRSRPTVARWRAATRFATVPP